MLPEKAIEKMSAEIAKILAENSPSIYIYGSYALDDFRLGWSDLDILVLTEKPISEKQAGQLVGLRQEMSRSEPDCPFYRLFEGGMLSLSAFIGGLPDRVVYWGTNGQKIAESYRFDAFCRKELLESGRLLVGRDIRGLINPPDFREIRENVRQHYESIRKYACLSGRSIYSFGWLLDIARCIYTLRTGDIISKTHAAEWALESRIFGDPAALETALEIRRNPRIFFENEELQDMAENLNPSVQSYADLLEKELEISERG